MRIQLLAIDVQNDFCGNGKNGQHKGSLYVPGADVDAERLARFVRSNINKIDAIHATMDSHMTHQIFHPAFWVNDGGKNPAPFTIMNNDFVTWDTWNAVYSDWKDKARDYVRALTAGGKAPLCIWPYHCIRGTVGQALVPSFSEAIMEWEIKRGTTAKYHIKGDYRFSEHYGVFEAEVPVAEVPSTQFNGSLLCDLWKAEVILVAGEALSHCVKRSVEQMAQMMGPDGIKKFVLFTDCCSNVNGFEKDGAKFIEDMVGRGMRTCRSDEFFA